MRITPQLSPQFSVLNPRYRRGSIIVLVVAVLALLAVIGTVYIVSARAQRTSAGAGNVAANMDMAQTAVNQIVASRVGSANLDSAGLVGGYNATPAAPNYGNQTARRWDIPELVVDTSMTPTSGRLISASSYNASYRDQAWLASNIYRSANDTNFQDLSFLTPAAFNPLSGQYDIPFFPASPAVAPGYPAPPGSVFLFNAVSDQYPGSPPSSIPNSNAAYDSFINLLPFSEGSGIRYRFGVRIIDTSSMANLNTGSVTNLPASPTDLTGTYNTSLMLTAPSIFMDGAGQATNLDANRLDGVAPLTYAKWQIAELRFEGPAFTTPLTPFDLSDELELRSFGSLGTFFPTRATQLLPATLGNISGGIVTGNFHRASYTTYSYSRDLRPFPFDPLNAANPAYVITGLTVFPQGNAVNNVWPTDPACVAANPDISDANASLVGVADDAKRADYLAIAATNIATAMEKVIDLAPSAPTNHYSHQEACAFAANYLTYRWSGWTVDTTKTATDSTGTSISAYYLPEGPSFVDGTGICIRAIKSDLSGPGEANYGSPSDLHSEAADKVYLGYAAQPFINEIAQRVHYDPAAPTATITDAAVELYNPYDFGLSLKGYKLRINATVDIDLSAAYIRPHGYFVLLKTSGNLSAKVDPAATTLIDSNLDLTGGGAIYLVRSYVNRAGAAQFAAVDQYGLVNLTTILSTALGTAAASVHDDDYYVRRANGDPVLDPYNWRATVHVQATAEMPQPVDGLGTAPEAMTLGKVNPKTDTSPGGLPLYDRYMIAGPPAQRDLLYNIAEFNHIMRVCHEISTSTTPSGNPATVAVTDDGVLSPHLGVTYTSAVQVPLANCQFPQEASIHFDFRSHPIIYTGPGLPIYNAPAPSDSNGDPRAMRLLECLAFIDRVSDYTFDFGDNAVTQGRSKIRIPGRINVNTAPAEVLATIPYLNAHPTLIGNIIAYRQRAAHTVVAAPYQGSADFNTGTYNGTGIRSMGELSVALSAGTTPTSLDARDQAWASVYNYLTVRSDTFAVYAYLEAVKQNPRYSGAFNNSTNWYLPSAPPGLVGVTDDPTDASKPLLRVGRRRWISILDRSYSNYPVGNNLFTQPRIVAQKDLPQ